MDIFAKTRNFIEETINELRKCNWPARDELFESTLLVIVSVIILTAFVFAVDQVSRIVINYITSG